MDAIFFPRKDYDVEICAHRLGKSMTYTDCTDTIDSNNVYNWYSGLGKARNIKLSAFIKYSDFVSFPQIIQDYHDGKLWCDIYSQTTTPELLLNPETATEEAFNDYYNNLWKPNFLNGINKIPCSLSYRTGKTYFSSYLDKYFLGGRSSDVDGKTDYGIGYGTPANVPYNKTVFEAKPNTLRWYDAVVYHAYGNATMAEEMAYLGALIDQTKNNGGWIRNFTHWHNPYNDNNQALVVQYLDLLQEKNGDGQIYFSGYGEALAYLAYREMITRAVMYSPLQSPSKLFIRLETSNVQNLNIDLLQVPISIKFTTVGTPLAGREIKCYDNNLISLGNEQYIVEIPFGRFPYAIIEKR